MSSVTILRKARQYLESIGYSRNPNSYFIYENEDQEWAIYFCRVKHDHNYRIEVGFSYKFCPDWLEKSTRPRTRITLHYLRANAVDWLSLHSRWNDFVSEKDIPSKLLQDKYLQVTELIVREIYIYQQQWMYPEYFTTLFPPSHLEYLYDFSFGLIPYPTEGEFESRIGEAALKFLSKWRRQGSELLFLLSICKHKNLYMLADKYIAILNKVSGHFENHTISWVKNNFPHCPPSDKLKITD